ncbi:MAG TPA: DUF423 domain-containing protein [Pelobium sp.]|nr:DUF423 domain-containing protein [Pelobium sp.]
MNKRIIITASIFGILAVIFGAFGAHILKGIINSSQIETWQTAVQYHFFHTLALLFLSTFARFKNNLINISSYFFVFGMIFFSGSLYLIALKDVLSINTSFIGPVTPLGGLFFIFGWMGLLLAAIKDK